jgi:hypothetical protein
LNYNFVVTASIFDPRIATHVNSNPSAEKFEGITMFPILNSPSSVGHLELCSSNPFLQPKIFLNYYEKPEDLYRMMSSLKLSREIFKQSPLSTVWGVKELGFNDEFGKYCSKDDEMSDEDWEQYIRKKVIL